MNNISFLARTIFFIGFFLIFFFLFFSYFLWQEEKKVINKVYPNVYINKINFSLKTREEIKHYFEKKNQELKTVKFFLTYKNSDYATYSGQILNLGFNTETIIKHAFLIGRSQNLETRLYQKIASLLHLDQFHLQADLTFNLKPIEEYLSFLEEKHNKKPVNALFEIKDNRVVAFKIDQPGLRIKSSETLNLLRNKIQSLKDKFEDNIKIEISDELVEPEVTLSAINNFGIVEKIGEGKSDFTGSISERIHNIKLATSKFHGVLIPKGEIFSFNKTVGDISSTTGYKPAYIIKNGRTVLGDGGGVCQVSTTLFRAALNSGLPIIERHGHAYRVSYYENDSKPGMDATVFAPFVDLKFKNDTPAHILIQSEIDDQKNLLVFSFYGKRDSRRIEISEITIWDVVSPPSPIYQEDPNLKKGITRQIDWPAWGAKAKFHYKVEKEGKTIVDQDFFTFYRPWPAVYLVGVGE